MTDHPVEAVADPGMSAPRRILYGVTVGESAWAFLRGQLRYFQDRGTVVTLVSSPGPRLDQAGRREGVDIVAVPMRRDISPVHDAISLVRWYKTLRTERPDVINVGTPKASLLGTIAAWISRTPRRVYVVRGLRYEGERGAKRALLIVMEKVTCRLATDVVAVSPSVAVEMRGSRISSKPIAVIGLGSSNGVDASEWASRAGAGATSTARKVFALDESDFVVGFVGRLNSAKGPQVLLEAMRVLVSRGVRATLLVVGEAEGADVEQQAEHDVNLKLVRTGWLDDPAEAMSAMDALCLPTFREGFPNVVLEASACGVCVVTTTATGARDSVVDGVTGTLTPPGDVRALADVLERLALDPALRLEMGGRGREWVSAEFQPDRIWSGLASIYAGTARSDPDITYY